VAIITNDPPGKLLKGGFPTLSPPSQYQIALQHRVVPNGPTSPLDARDW